MGALIAMGLAVAAGTAAQDVPWWRLSAEPLLQIGVVEGDPDYEFFRAVSSVRLEDGRIAVLNAGSHQLRLYDSAGRIVGSAGRKGRGPGEFSMPVRLYRLGRDTLQVYDRGNARFSVHALDGRFVRTEPAPLDRGRFMYDEWLYNRSWIDGPTLGRGREAVRAAIDALPEPDAAAGYRYVKVTARGHLWVRRPGRPGVPVEWLVYDLAARPIGRVVTPASFEIHEIGRNYVVGTGRDELDVEYIRLYGLAGAADAPVAAAALGAAGVARSGRTIPRDVIREMQGTLRQLATQQEIFYSKTGTGYAGEVRQLEDWEEPETVLVRVVNASDRGWTALVVDKRTGATCGMTYGAFAPVGWPSGMVTCE